MFHQWEERILIKIIAIEGPSRVGKDTQSQMLYDRLSTIPGLKVAKMARPRYDTSMGKLIYEMLHNKEKPIDELTLHFLYTAEIADMQSELNKLAFEGYDFVIIDRYTLTQEVYGTICRGYSTTWCESIHNHFIQPHLNIVIDLDPKEALARANFREGDQYEQKLDLQDRLRRQFNECKGINLKYDDSITEIVNGSGQPHEVHNEIIDVVCRHFGDIISKVIFDNVPSV